MRSVNGPEQQRRTTRGQDPLPGDGDGATRRDFMYVAGAAGVAAVLAPPSSARAHDLGAEECVDPNDEGWQLVGDFEDYDEGFDYAYFNGDCREERWVEIDLDEEEHPEYDYVTVWVYEGHTFAEWERAEADEPHDDEYEYLNFDDSPVDWHFMEEFEIEDPDHLYVYEFEDVDEEGFPTVWEWIEDGDVFDTRYRYAFELAECNGNGL